MHCALAQGQNAEPTLLRRPRLRACTVLHVNNYRFLALSDLAWLLRGFAMHLVQRPVQRSGGLLQVQAQGA